MDSLDDVDVAVPETLNETENQRNEGLDANELEPLGQRNLNNGNDLDESVPEELPEDMDEEDEEEEEEQDEEIPGEPNEQVEEENEEIEEDEEEEREDMTDSDVTDSESEWSMGDVTSGDDSVCSSEVESDGDVGTDHTAVGEDDQENDDSDSSDQELERPQTVRRSARPRTSRRVLTYNKLGGTPKISRYTLYSCEDVP